MAGYQRLALTLSWPVLLAGCQMIPQGWRPDEVATATAKSDLAKSDSAQVAAKPAGAEATAKVSLSAAGDATATAPGPQTVQQHEIQTTLDQLQSHGKLTPQARRQLEADLAQSDPDSISRILRMLKSSLSTAAGGTPLTDSAAAANPASPAEAAGEPAAPQDFETARRQAVAKAAALIESISDVPPSAAGGRAVPAVAVSARSAAVRRLPPAPQEVFQAYETLLAARYPHTDPAEHAEPALLAALATQLAANAKPMASAAAAQAASGREDWRDETAMLASFVGDSKTTPPGAQPPAAVKSSPAVNAATATAAAVTPSAELPGAWRDSLTHFIERLEEQKDRPAATADELRQQVYLRLLYVMAGRREEALEPIPGLSLPEQEFWNKLVYGLSTYLDENRIPNRERRAGEAKLYFADAATRLGEVSTLAVAHAAFCTAVRSFGVIERFPQDDFLPGSEVLIYAELDNFVAERQPAGYRTEFRASYLIFDRLGQPVETEPHELPVITETCDNLRHDFFISYRVRLPERMNPGEHQLKLTVHDTVGQKIGTAEVKFNVAGAK